jgi:hypothetical protein
MAAPRTLVIACGALARELTELARVNRWEHLAVTCLPAELHNRPERIPDAVRSKIHAARGKFDHVLCLYADCGTGGLLDKVLQEEGVERIAGAHCYEFYAGAAEFAAMMDTDPATFFLTDYLARHFDRLVIKGLGLDRHPELHADYFRNYRRVVYLAQSDEPSLRERAEAAARRLGLPLEIRRTGLAGLDSFLAPHAPAES